MKRINKKGIKDKVKKQVKAFGMTLLALLMTARPVYASEPAIVSGTRDLLAWATGIITGLLVAWMTYCAAKPIMKYMDASPEEKPKYKKEAKDVIIAGVFIATLGSTITFILAKYGA